MKASFNLVATLCQFTQSKTDTVLNFIKWFSLTCNFIFDSKYKCNHGTHKIHLIVTNRNLEETKQWKIRTKKELGDLDIHVLSSKKGSSYKNCTSLLGDLVMKVSSGKSRIPDVIIMCAHHQRFDDIITIVDTLNGGTISFEKIGIKNIDLSLYFDEADKNIGPIVKCLDSLSCTKSEDENNILENIYFITATPFESFWKKLKELGITTLKNALHLRERLSKEPKTHGIEGVKFKNFDECYEEYRKFNDHNLKIVNEDSSKPLKFAKIVLKEIFLNYERSKDKNPMIIFVPSDERVKSHIEMKELIQSDKNYNFWVLIHNGNEKCFYSPSGDIYNIEEFSKGELKDVLTEWKKQYPNENLAITGHKTIQRGVTFNTIGFNFTDMILYDIDLIADLIQFIGRSNGGKQYVDIMNIWISKETNERINNRLEISYEFYKRNPEECVEEDFKVASKKDLNQACYTEPVIIQTDEKEFISSFMDKDINGKVPAKGKGNAWNSELIINNFIKPINPEIANELNSKLEKLQISMPTSVRSYKTHISEILEKGTKWVDDHNDDKHKGKNVYQIFLDNKTYKIIILRYYGEYEKKGIMSVTKANMLSSTEKEEDSDDIIIKKKKVIKM